MEFYFEFNIYDGYNLKKSRVKKPIAFLDSILRVSRDLFLYSTQAT